MKKEELNNILEIGSDMGMRIFEKGIKDGYTIEQAKTAAVFGLHLLGFKKLFIDSFLKNLNLTN